MTSRRVLCLGFLVASFSACGGDDGPLIVPAAIAKVQGSDGDTGFAGFRLTKPLQVDVTTGDLCDGGSVGGSAGQPCPAPRAAVRWKVTQGVGADLSDSVTFADGNGRAQVYVTPGGAVGLYVIRASLVLNDSKFVNYGAFAIAPPTLTSVVPATFTGGDTITVQGTALDSGAVEISGMPARTLTRSATSLTAIVPVCLVPGAVSVHARVRQAVSKDVIGTYAASGAAVRLTVGDYASIDPSQLAGCATFPAAGANGAEYVLAPQAVTGSPGLQAAYRLAGDSVVVTAGPAPNAAPPLPFAERFHDFLRVREADIARLPKPAGVAAAPGAAAASSAKVKVGDRRTFRVCSKIGCQTTADFAQISAEAKFVGNHTAVFQDITAAAGGFVQTDFDGLGSVFENGLYALDTKTFGVESDIDNNGVVIILLTPKVNGLTSRADCGTSIVTGFFFGIDIDPSFAKDDRSNKGEVFYALAPDPSGAASCPLSIDVVRRLVPTTFVHEFQHMISYNQHVLLRGGEQETLWLNEAMSHLAEELGGRAIDPGLDTTFSRFVIGDLYDAFLFLKTPGSFYLFPSEGTATLEERGGGWLFLRWLVDKFGTDLTRRLEETNLTGEVNVSAATGEALASLLPQWFLANYVSDLPAFVAQPRLKYDSWKFRTTYASLNQQSKVATNFDRPFPLVPSVFNSGTFAVTGSLQSGSGDYYRVVQAANGRGFTVKLTSSTGGAIDPTPLPRLNVIRIR